MDLRRLKPSRLLLQLLWTPKVGDRVLVTTNKRQMARIVDENTYGTTPEYKLDISPDTWWNVNLLTYIPRRRAYHEALLNLQKYGIFEWVEFDNDNKYKLKAALRCNQTLLFLNGTSASVLSDILNYRSFDSLINDAINKLVLETRGIGAVRLKSVK